MFADGTVGVLMVCGGETRLLRFKTSETVGRIFTKMQHEFSEGVRPILTAADRCFK